MYWGEIRRGLSETLRQNGPGIVLIVPRKANSYELLGSPERLKKAEPRSTVVNRLSPVELVTKGHWGLEQLGNWE